MFTDLEEIIGHLERIRAQLPGALDEFSPVKLSYRGSTLEIHSPGCMSGSLEERFSFFELSEPAQVHHSCAASLYYHGGRSPLINVMNRILSATPGSFEEYASSVWLASRYYGYGSFDWFKESPSESLLSSAKTLIKMTGFTSWPSHPEGRWCVFLPGWCNERGFPGDPSGFHFTRLADLHLLALAKPGVPLGNFILDLGEARADDAPAIMETALILAKETVKDRGLSSRNLDPYDFLETARGLER